MKEINNKIIYEDDHHDRRRTNSANFNVTHQ